ncbi:OST-HTH/LOTUS domain-containing protein, partial [uncultured Micrococcus sp.]|uniref:OST-HTH/LOTUS domain-containing protein n=1 Tax=uncultured Micrococcus sp. TaxID=114051 RepID=UPI002600D647
PGLSRGAGRGSVLVDVESDEVITPAEDPTPPDVRADDGDSASGINLQSALVKAVNATSGDDGWAPLSLIGQHMSRTHVDFDPRDFGHSKLSTLVADQPYLETRTEGRTMEVTLKQRRRR